MFKRLTKDFPISQYQIQDRKIGFGSTVDGEFQGIEYYYAESADRRRMFDVIPAEYQSSFCLLLMRANCLIPPHTDSGILTTVNFYIRTDYCDTEFYQVVHDRPRLSQVGGQTDGHIIDYRDLCMTGLFRAHPGQAWVLDVSQPHSVLPRGEFSERLAFSLSTADYDYATVCKFLTSTGNL